MIVVKMTISVYSVFGHWALAVRSRAVKNHLHVHGLLRPIDVSGHVFIVITQFSVRLVVCLDMSSTPPENIHLVT